MFTVCFCAYAIITVLPICFKELSMGMVVIQSYILVSKLKKTKTEFLRWTGYLNSIKKTYKARFISNSSSCTTTELSKLLTSCLTAVKTYYQIL